MFPKKNQQNPLVQTSHLDLVFFGYLGVIELITSYLTSAMPLPTQGIHCSEPWCVEDLDWAPVLAFHWLQGASGVLQPARATHRVNQLQLYIYMRTNPAIKFKRKTTNIIVIYIYILEILFFLTACSNRSTKGQQRFTFHIIIIYYIYNWRPKEIPIIWFLLYGPFSFLVVELM